MPELSILVPFRNDDCEPLIASLLQAAQALQADLEVVAADDRGDDPLVRQRLQVRLAGVGTPAAILIAARNLGRSAIRNVMAGVARAEHLLFIDAGMEVSGPRYLEAYLAWGRSAPPGLVFGGYAATDAVLRRADALAAREFLSDQCQPAAVRRRRPWQYVYAGNLLVHRRVAEACPFDESFRGWGWEDVELGVRAGRSFAIDHIDNPVLRTNLSAASELCRRFEESAGNFARAAQLHPREMEQLAIFRAARIAARVPRRAVLQRGLRWLALRHGLPGAVRLAALKLYRACIYAGFLENPTARTATGRRGKARR
jgi:glycosyltransferase involved in cell wall biosynthesis